MLLVNGGLAVLNGLLVATGKIWCECFRGGICCGGVCYCDTPGVCCDNVWINEDGTSPGLEGLYKCCYDSNGTVTFEVLTPIDVDCEGEEGRCCEGGICNDMAEGSECNGELLSGSCARFGCPEPCCTEDAEGTIFCEIVDAGVCTGIVDFVEPTCETACRGACCIDGELTQNSPLQQGECDDIGGCWWGVGSTSCGTEGFCQPPFSLDCCESVVSSAQRLTFTGPRRKRCPKLSVCGVQVTVEVTTRAPIFVHGGLFGSGPYDLCTDETTFTLCNDQFHITPANPCSGNLQEINVKACWDDDDEPSELLRFRCCQNIKHLIGNCDCDCVTTVLYEGGECTSNAQFVMRGDAIIDASGTGALVLTGDITHENGCERTLTLTGSNAGNNWISGKITDGSGTSVDKGGPGLWRLSAASGYSKKLRVLSGTLVIDGNVPTQGGSPYGTATGEALRPEIGEGGTATLLIEGGRTISRGVKVVAGGGVVTIGMTGSGTTLYAGGVSIDLGRDLTLRAADGGTMRFNNQWREIGGGLNPAFAFTIGAPGNSGTVIFGSLVPASITAVDVRHGTLRLDAGTETIDFEVPVTLGSAGVTLDLNGTTQSLASLTFEGSGSTVIGPGLLRTFNNGGTAQITANGSGHTISADVELADATTITSNGDFSILGDVSGSGSLVVENVISGASLVVGSLTLKGAITYTGETSIMGGTLVVENHFAGSADISLVAFTLISLVVTFTMNPVSGATYKLLGGSTSEAFFGPRTVTLANAGGATGTYNSATSTLTID